MNSMNTIKLEEKEPKALRDESSIETEYGIKISQQVIRKN